MTGIDFDAILAESRRENVPLTIGGQTFDLPPELPLDVVAPFLADDLGLVDLIGKIIAEDDDDAEEDKGLVDMVFDVLKAHPALPFELVSAAKESLRLLLGDDAYAAFLGIRPGLQSTRALVQALVGEYGVSLLDFFSSDAESDSTGDASKETSSDSTDSTPEGSGDAPETPEGSSEPDDS